jgi:hypothetical protein
MGYLTIDIDNMVNIVVFRLKLKRGNHILSDEEVAEVINIMQCIYSAGYNVAIVAQPPAGCLYTAQMLMESISRMRGNHDGWQVMQSPAELFEELTMREKQILPLLAMNTNAKVVELTGLEFNYVKTIRQRINFKTRCNSPAMLRVFYDLLLLQGIVIPAWTPKREKKKRPACRLPAGRQGRQGGS